MTFALFLIYYRNTKLSCKSKTTTKESKNGMCKLKIVLTDPHLRRKDWSLNPSCSWCDVPVAAEQQWPACFPRSPGSVSKIWRPHNTRTVVPRHGVHMKISWFTCFVFSSQERFVFLSIFNRGWLNINSVEKFIHKSYHLFQPLQCNFPREKW